MTKTIRILDADKFVYIQEACRFYSIAYEEVNDDVSGRSEQNPVETPRKSGKQLHKRLRPDDSVVREGSS